MRTTRQIAICVVIALALVACGRGAGPTEVSIFRWDLNIAGEDPIGKALESRLGVHIEALTSPWTGWSDKLNAMVASGDIPDVFVGYGIMDRPQYERWIRDGLLLALSDHLAPYRSLREYAERWAEQRIGGKLYSFPVEAYVDHVLMVRGDWLAELGLAAPRTVDDLIATARAFRDRYGIYPVSSSAPHTAGLFWLNMFLYAYGSSWEDWEKAEAGDYVPSWIAPKSLDALRYIRQLYTEGLLDPDFVTNSDDVKKEKFAKGEVAIVTHNLVSDYRQALKQVTATGEITVLPPVSGPGGQGMWGLNGYFSAVMVNAGLDAGKRAKVLGLLDYLYSTDGIEILRYGVKGVHHRADNGRHVPLLPTESATGLPLLLERAAPYATLKFLRALEWMWMPEWSPDYAEMQGILEIGQKYSRPAEFPFVLTEAQSDVGQQLVDFTFQEWVKLITTSKDIDGDWARFVARFRELGGDRLIKEMNEAIAAGK